MKLLVFQKKRGNESRQKRNVTSEISHDYKFPKLERKKWSQKSCYDEDNLETITAMAIKRPHRHFCQMRSAQPLEALLELASTTALDSAVAGGTGADCGLGAPRDCSTTRRGVDCD